MAGKDTTLGNLTQMAELANVAEFNLFRVAGAWVARLRYGDMRRPWTSAPYREKEEAARELVERLEADLGFMHEAPAASKAA